MLEIILLMEKVHYLPCKTSLLARTIRRNANEPGHFIPLDLYFAFFILHCVPHCSPRLSISARARALSASYGGVMDGGAGSKAGSELSGTISLETILLFLLL